MLFKDVIGQRQVKQQLVEMVQYNRLSHAGRRQLRRFARRLRLRRARRRRPVGAVHRRHAGLRINGFTIKRNVGIQSGLV